MLGTLQRLGRVCLAAGLLLHFGLMLLQVSHGRDWLERTGRLPGLVRFSDQYRAVTSANRNFRFFAPSVSDSWRVRLALRDGTGAEHPFELPAPTRELTIRRVAMLDHFFRDAQSMDRYARSWASYALARGPTATSATVEVRRVRSPGLEAYRAGDRWREEPYFQVVHAR